MAGGAAGARHGGSSGPHPWRRRCDRSAPGSKAAATGPSAKGEIRTIHAAALDVLERLGMAQALPSCIEACTARGAFLNEHGRLCFPRALVEDVVAGAARRFPLYGQDPRHDLEPWGSKVHFGTAGAAVHMVDLKTREYRELLLQDLYDAARIVDALDHVHFFQRTLVPRDMVGAMELDLNTLYACIAGTTKHVGTSFCRGDTLNAGLEILHLVAGGEAAWRARPFVSLSCCFVVPPLRFAEDACRGLEVAVAGGMPVLLLSAGQAGATSPAALAGSVVQAVAEVLAGLCYVNALKPGAPAIFGTWPFVSDLRTGAMSGGSAEQALLDGRLRPDGPVLRPADRRRLRHERFQAARRPVGGGEGLQPRAGRQCRRQPDLRGGRDAGEPARLQPREPGHRQRHHRRVLAHHPRHRGDRGVAVVRDHAPGLPRGPGPLSRQPADAGR